MKNHKTIKNGFVWLPENKRTGKIPGAKPPRKPETRNPVLWLARFSNELYLVNNSQESLEFVIADSFGINATYDDALVIPCTEQYAYKGVNPGDAVKIDEYDAHYDSEWIIQISLKIKSMGLGYIKITTPSQKGGINETVLIWDSGEIGKDITYDQHQEKNAIPSSLENIQSIQTVSLR